MQLIDQKIVAAIQEEGLIDGETMVSLSGTADKLREAWNALRWNLLLALAITYLLMAALFESWLYPFVILFSVPLGAVGGVLGLWVLNFFVFQALDILTMLGFIILIGTVVNNAILIVHQSLNYIRGGWSPQGGDSRECPNANSSDLHYHHDDRSRLVAPGRLSRRGERALSRTRFGGAWRFDRLHGIHPVPGAYRLSLDAGLQSGDAAMARVHLFGAEARPQRPVTPTRHEEPALGQSA